MKYPDLPCFNIPPEHASPSRDLSPDEYNEWVMENVRQLRENGQYEKLRKDPLRTPADVRFQLKEDD